MESALPNLHPALVHFPVALLPLALCVELVWLFRQQRETARLGAAVWVLAAVTATAALFAGRAAADGLSDVPPLAQPAIADHSDWASATVLLAWVIALARLAVERSPEARWGRALRGASSALGVVLVGLTVVTADKGGALVYEHALAVTLPEPKPVEVLPRPDVESVEGAESGPDAPVLEQQGNEWTWRPAPEQAAVFGAKAWPERGAAYSISGAHTWLFEPRFADVQVNIWLDLTSFEGEVRLLHHVNGEDGGALALSTDGRARLLSLGAAPSELDAAQATLSGRHAVSVNVAGRHLKGMVDGQMVVHGHAPAQPPGQVGVRFEGAGVVGVELVEVIPLEGP
ncbi:MAG: hypothetical protein H6741_27610 [Alphaproteobacteria bacterium]|nr:hypothetical protein [Alphaproteobacteria bacterium]